MDKDFSNLTSEIFKEVFLRAKESKFLGVILIFVGLVFIPPLIGYLQGLVKSVNYALIATNVFLFLQTNVSIVDWFLLILLVFLLVSLWRLDTQLLKTRVIKDDFSSEELSEWSIPSGSVWTTESAGDRPGKMLSVTDSYYPGTLKGAYGWYDYQVTFWAKIDGDVPSSLQNFSIAIRSENSLNGIMLQITKTHCIPYLLYNGTYIRDEDNSQMLRTTLKTNTWIQVKIIVKGNNADVWVDNYHVQYKIETRVFNAVDTSLLSVSKTPTLKEIRQSNDDIQAKRAEIIKKAETGEKLTSEEDKKNLWSELSAEIAKIPSNTRIVLEYQKGSFGFRESGKERAYFRNLSVSKI